MSGRKGLLTIGGIAAAAGGYYFYQAGGDPKVAKKEVERKLVHDWLGSEGMADKWIKMTTPVPNVRRRAKTSQAKRQRKQEKSGHDGPARRSTAR